MDTRKIRDLRARHEGAKRLFTDKTQEVIDLSLRYPGLLEKLREVRDRVLDRALKGEGSDVVDLWIAIEGEHVLRDAMRRKSREWDELAREVDRLLEARIQAEGPN